MRSRFLRRGVFPLLFLLAALCLLSACGGDQAAATASPPPQQTGQTSSPAASPPSAATATPAPEVTGEVTQGPEVSPAPEPTAPPADGPDTSAPPTQGPVATATPPAAVADATALAAAELTAGTRMFSTGVTAEQFLKEVNAAIIRWETVFAATDKTDGPSDSFNWHAKVSSAADANTVLKQVQSEVLDALGVTQKEGTDAYKKFDYQVYYSRLIDLLGGPLPWSAYPG